MVPGAARPPSVRDSPGRGTGARLRLADGVGPSVVSLICEAIRTHSLLEFEYHGRHRVVAPYCHGVSTRGVEVLRGVQVGGRSGSGGHGFGFGKLWVVSEVSNLRVSDEHFKPDDPHYNPEDRGMAHIHCRIESPQVRAVAAPRSTSSPSSPSSPATPRRARRLGH